MGQRAQTLQDFLTSSASAVAELPVTDFVRRWRMLTGEPPAVLLASRTEMLALLVESTPAAPLEPQVPTWDDRELDAGTAR
ncbi:hypothetical protein ABIE45_004510 [Methylobacterium sp. OAE515]